MFGSNFTEGGGKHPPPSAAPGRKSPVLLGLNFLQGVYVSRILAVSSNGRARKMQIKVPKELTHGPFAGNHS